MTTVKATERDMTKKAKRLRREGFVPGIVCGKEMKESLPIIIDMPQATRFLAHNRKGNKVTLEVGGKKISAIIKDTKYNALLKQIEYIDFQALVKGEKIHTTAQIVLKNEKLAKGCINQELEEISYKAEPDDLVEEFVVDFEKFPGTRCIKVEDLGLEKNTKIDIVTPGDTVIVSVDEASVLAVEDDDDTATTTDDTAATTEA